MSGLSTTGSISFGLALVAGRNRVPRPATGNTAVRIIDLPLFIAKTLRSGRPHRVVGSLGPLEHRRAHAVPGAALRAAPVPPDTVETTVIALIAPAHIADARQERTQRAGLVEGFRAKLRTNARELGHLLGRNCRGEQPRELPRSELATLPQPPTELVQNVWAVRAARDGEDGRDDLERETRRTLQRVQIEPQRPDTVSGELGDPRGEDVGPRQAGTVRAGLPQQRAGALAVALYQRVLGELAQVVRGDASTLELHRRRQLVEHLERLRPVALGLVDGDQVIERAVAVLTGGRQLFEHPLGAIHQPGALVVEGKGESRLLTHPAAALIAQPRVNGDRPVHFAAPAEEASECELNLRRIALGLRHASKDFGSVIEAVVDQVIEADVVVTRQPYGTRGAIAAAEKPGRQAHQDEGQGEQQWRQFEHGFRRYQVRVTNDNRASARRCISVANRSTGAFVDALAQVFPRLEVRHMLARERHGLTGLGVAALTWRAKVQREAAEAANLDALTLRERIAHDLQNLLQRQLDIFRRQVLLLGGDDLDEFGLGHRAQAPQRLSPDPICSFSSSPRLVPEGCVSER